MGLTLWVALLAAPFACADTVHLKDGTTVDGAVTQPDAATVVVQVGAGKMTFAATDVVRVEKNDKKGDATVLSAIRGKEHEDALQQRTGLTAEQRDLVGDAMQPLWSPDEGERNAARKKLVALGKQMPVFQYLESYLPYSKGLIAPELMKALVELDPKNAKGLVHSFTLNSDPANRAQALQLVAAYATDDDIDTVARGLIDFDPRVRVAAAHALDQAGAKRATPALIQALDSADPQVKNAVRTALCDLWGASGAQPDLNTSAEWTRFWSSKARGVKGAIDPATLEPLVTREALAASSPTHDE
jgi:HEAT repeat protein